MVAPDRRSSARTAKPDSKKICSRKGLLRAKIPVLLRLPDVRLAGTAVTYRWSDLPWDRFAPIWLFGVAAASVLVVGLWVRSRIERHHQDAPALSLSSALEPTSNPSSSASEQPATTEGTTPLVTGNPPTAGATGRAALTPVDSGGAADLIGIVVPVTEGARHAPFGSGSSQDRSQSR